jgi:hypothetical protein
MDFGIRNKERCCAWNDTRLKSGIFSPASNSGQSGAHENVRPQPFIRVTARFPTVQRLRQRSQRRPM